MTRLRQHAPLDRSRVVSVVAAIVCALPTLTPANQGAPSAAVKAELLLNLAKFTEWPAAVRTSTIDYCVVGDDAVASALGAAARGERIAGRRLRVHRGARSFAWARCHVLFIGEGGQSKFAEELSALRATPVLTVSDATGFARSRGIVELYLEGDRMRFAINVPAAKRAGLRLSSRLLSLARVVRSAGAL